MPEFDTPGHTSSWGPGAGPNFLTRCYDQDGNPDGTLGPINPIYAENYLLMKRLLTEVAQVFDDAYLHLGGDEVPFGCWESNPDITEYMAANNLTTYPQLEQQWVQGMVEIAESLKKHYVVWEEVFVNGVKINNNTVVEVTIITVRLMSKDSCRFGRITTAGTKRWKQLQNLDIRNCFKSRSKSLYCFNL